MDTLCSRIAYKLLLEQCSINPVVANSSNPVPISPERYNLILREMHEAQLKTLQSAHDSSLYELQQLKQQQQSGTQQHLVVSEKRQLSLQIGRTHRAQKELINKMTPHVRYIVDNTENHNIPIDWKKLAMQGEPYWREATEESALTPSTAEKNSIVESYLKRQRAWEQLTIVLPRETLDAMRFFWDIERRSLLLMRRHRLHSQLDGLPTSRETEEFHSGCLTVCNDVCVKTREYHLACRDVWNRIENELLSAEIIEITSISGEDGQVPAYLKINATVPFLPISLQPSVDLLGEYLTEYDEFLGVDTPDWADNCIGV